MNKLLLNLVMALSWAAFTGNFSLESLILGFLLGMAILAFLRRDETAVSYVVRLRRLLVFTVFYLKELVVSSLRVANDVIRPRHSLHPGIIAIPLDAKTPTEITVLATLLTLTPGSTTVTVSEEDRLLYLHHFYLDPEKIEEIKLNIKRTYERQVLELMR